MMQTRTTLPLLFLTLLVSTVPQTTLAADEGAKTFEEVCTQCHTPKKQPLDKQHLTRDQWKEAIERMAGYGAEVSKGKMADLLDYLVRTNGPAGATDTGKK
jgi:mono/diheme cytochrome c family protein